MRESKSAVPNEMFVTGKFIDARYGIDPATRFRWYTEGDFPKPYKFGARSTRWKMSEVIAWEESKRAEVA